MLAKNRCQRKGGWNRLFTVAHLVRFGSLADIPRCNRHVRFTESEQSALQSTLSGRRIPRIILAVT